MQRPGIAGYGGWLHREDRRLLRQVEREVLPSVREMEEERRLRSGTDRKLRRRSDIEVQLRDLNP